MLRTESQIRWFQTILLLVIFALINACVNSFYATLIDFADLLDTTIPVVSKGLSIRCFGGCIGAFLGGFLFMYVDRFIACAIFLVLAGFASGLITTSTSMISYSICKVILGLAEGVARGGVLMTMGDIWGEKARPFLQSIQFVRIIAGTVTPLIFSPFLSKRDETLNISISFNHTHNHTIEAEDIQRIAKTEIWIPYMWLGLFMNTTAIVSVLMVYYSYRYTKKFNLDESNEKKPKNAKIIETSDNAKVERFYKIITSILHCSMIFWVSALNIIFNQFWTAFVLSIDLHINKQSGLFMLAMFGLAMTLGSVISIFLAAKFRSLSIILILLVPMFAGKIIMSIYAHTSELMLWIGGILLSIGLGTLQGPVYSSLDERIHVSNLIGAFYVLGANISLASGIPMYIGNNIEENPFVLVHFVSICLNVVLIHVGVVDAVDKWKLKQIGIKVKPKEKMINFFFYFILIASFAVNLLLFFIIG